jgi:hypothetical protein
LTGALVESGPYPDLITNPLPWLTTLYVPAIWKKKKEKKKEKDEDILGAIRSSPLLAKSSYAYHAFQLSHPCKPHSHPILPAHHLSLVV